MVVFLQMYLNLKINQNNFGSYLSLSLIFVNHIVGKTWFIDQKWQFSPCSVFYYTPFTEQIDLNILFCTFWLRFDNDTQSILSNYNLKVFKAYIVFFY